ncbi:MAG: Uma2 family endonuclease [Planctomycetes bacterium]|nr:Uma2 family endonuclease [Planctomycetota bacterium]
MATRASADPPITYDVLCRMPDDGKRYELLAGDLFVTPSPFYEHQKCIGNLYAVLHAHVRHHRLGEVFTAPFDVVFTEQDVTQPDLLYIAKERLGIIRGVVRGAPDLCVEVLSESTEDRDRTVKRRLYAREGVRHYWLVDPAGRTLTELVRLGNAYRQRRVWTGEEQVRPALFPGLEFPRAALWE